MPNLEMLCIFSSIILVTSCFFVVISKNPVFSLLSLVASFLSSAFLLFLIECEFLALIFIIVYIGAIAILFLFSIMMLESKLNNLFKNNLLYVSVGFLFIFFVLSPLLYIISLNFQNNYNFNNIYLNFYQNWYDLVDCVNDIEVYGQILYSYFVLQFLISGFIILLVLISIVYLTNSFFNKSSNNQSLFKQLSRNSKFF